MSDIRAIEVPKWGLSMEEGTLTDWLIEEGDSFAAQQEVCEIETSKISNVMQAPFAGVLRRKVAQPGQTIPVGGVLGIVADASVSDAEIDAYLAQRGVAEPAPVSESVPAETTAQPLVKLAASAPAAASQPSVKTPGAWQVPQALLGASDEALFATPHALKLAAQLNINLSRVPGSGREGRISVADIEAAVRAEGGKSPAERLRKKPIRPHLRASMTARFSPHRWPGVWRSSGASTSTTAALQALAVGCARPMCSKPGRRCGATGPGCADG